MHKWLGRARGGRIVSTNLCSFFVLTFCWRIDVLGCEEGGGVAAEAAADACVEAQGCCWVKALASSKPPQTTACQKTAGCTRSQAGVKQGAGMLGGSRAQQDTVAKCIIFSLLSHLTTAGAHATSP